MAVENLTIVTEIETTSQPETSERLLKQVLIEGQVVLDFETRPVRFTRLLIESRGAGAYTISADWIE